MLDKLKYLVKLEEIILILDIQHPNTLECLISYDLLLNDLVRDYFAEFSKDQIEGHLVATARSLNKQGLITAIKAQRKL